MATSQRSMSCLARRDFIPQHSDLSGAPCVFGPLQASTDGHHHRQFSHGQVFVATASEKMMSLPRGFGLCTYSDSIDGLARHHP